MANDAFSRLSYEQIMSMAEQLGSSSQSMEQVLNEIKNLFENVGDEGTWSGTAASNTKERFDELSDQFHLFYEAITSCQKYLGDVVERYKSVDSVLTGQQQ